MLVPYNSREWFLVEKPVHFPIGVVLQSNENTFAFNYRRSRCNAMWGFKHVLYIFICVVMQILWTTFPNIPLHAETDPAKSLRESIPRLFNGGVHYDHPLYPGLQPCPPSQTPGGLGQRYWSVSEVTWPPKSGVSEVGGLHGPPA